MGVWKSTKYMLFISAQPEIQSDLTEEIAGGIASKFGVAYEVYDFTRPADRGEQKQFLRTGTGSIR